MDIQVKKKLLWATLISALLMTFLLLKVEIVHFTLIAGRMDIKYLIASCSVFIFGNLIRTFRFIQLDHTDKKLTQWWNINAFYNFITATLPGGAGEAASAYALKRFSKFNLLGALRILLISRLMELFALSMLFFIAAILISSDTPYREAAIWISGALFLISSVALLQVSEQFVIKLMQWLPGQGNLARRICKKLSEMARIAEEQRNNKSFVIALLQSVLIMIVAVISIHFALRSFGVDFTLVQSFYCFGIYALFQTIPLQGIAGIGTQAAWWALALNASGYRAPNAIAIGFVVHGTFYLFIAFLGFFSLLLRLKRIKKN